MAEALLTWIRDHGWLGVALFLAIENIGVPWPTTLAYVVAIELVRLGELGWPGAFCVCVAGHLIGSLVAYGLGRGGENAVMRHARRSDGLTRTVEWLHTWFARHGAVTILVARLVGYVRPWASFAAGLGEVPLLPFVAWTALGTAIHVALALWMVQAGFWFWDAYPGLRVAVVVVLALIFWGAFFYAAIRTAYRRVAARRRGTSQGDDAQASQTPEPAQTPPVR